MLQPYTVRLSTPFWEFQEFKKINASLVAVMIHFLPPFGSFRMSHLLALLILVLMLSFYSLLGVSSTTTGNTMMMQSLLLSTPFWEFHLYSVFTRACKHIWVNLLSTPFWEFRIVFSDLTNCDIDFDITFYSLLGVSCKRF